MKPIHQNSKSPDPSVTYFVLQTIRLDDPNPNEATKALIVIAEGLKLGAEGIEAMKRIASQVVGRYDDQAYYLRDLLLSLYNGKHVDLSSVMALHSEIRKDLCTVIMTLGRGKFADYMIREILIEAGDRDAAWFLEEYNLKASTEDSQE
jgi:hypothetical protein